jgi:N-methylhydantoinase A/oxoprolinase/acetone carboxylase beta subunit
MAGIADRNARPASIPVYFEADAGGDWAKCPIWCNEALLAGNEVAGSAFIEETSAAAVLYPGHHAHRASTDGLMVEVGSSRTTET